MTKPARGSKRPSIVSLLCMAVTLVLGCFILASKTNAQDPSPNGPPRGKAAIVARIAAPASSAPLPVAAPAAEPGGEGRRARSYLGKEKLNAACPWFRRR